MSKPNSNHSDNELLQNILSVLQEHLPNQANAPLSLEQENSNPINFREFLFELRKYWYAVLGSLICALILFLYLNARMPDRYEMSTVINLKSAGSDLASGESGFSFGFANNNLTESRIAILKSYGHNKRVAKTLNWPVLYLQSEGFIQTQSINHEVFEVIIDAQHPQLLGYDFYVNIEGNSLLIDLEKNQSQIRKFYPDEDRYDEAMQSVNGVEGKLGHWIEAENFKFKVIKTNIHSKKSEKSDLVFRFFDSRTISKWGVEQVKLDQSLGDGLLQISMEGENPEMLVEYLNTSVAALQDFEITQKTLAAKNTIEFIDLELAKLYESIELREDTMEQFRSDNLIINIEMNTSELLTKLNELEKERALILSEQSILAYVSEFLVIENLQPGVSLPSLGNVQDEMVKKLTSELFQNIVELDNLSASLESGNPAILKKEREIDFLKSSLKNSLGNAYSSSKVRQNQIEKNLSALEAKIGALPASEQEWISLTRRYTVEEKQYNLLLENRAEASIMMASSIADSQIIDPAFYRGQNPIGPNRTQNLLLFILIGLALPNGIILLLQLINNRITSRQQLELYTTIPTIGSIPLSARKTQLMVLKKPNSATAESFRAIRANLRFTSSNGHEGSAYAITSAVSGEGKTFTAMNLASVLSLSGERTILIGADLRKPKIYNDFNLKNEMGLSSFLAGIASLDEIIQSTEYSNLDIITAGPTPPNPFELLGNNNFEKLMTSLKGEYSYVVVDTPPLGLVADIITINHLFDGIFYMVRHNSTHKESLNYINSLVQNKTIQNVSIIFNAIPKNAGYGYGYGYGYVNE